MVSLFCVLEDLLTLVNLGEVLAFLDCWVAGLAILKQVGKGNAVKQVMALFLLNVFYQIARGYYDLLNSVILSNQLKVLGV